MSKVLGDFLAGTVIDTKFNTIGGTGDPATITSGVVSCYKTNSTTQSTAGITLTTDFDALTGLHNVRVDTSADGTFYSRGAFFQLILTAGTVDGVSVAGQIIAEFTLGMGVNIKSVNDVAVIGTGSELDTWGPA